MISIQTVGFYLFKDESVNACMQSTIEINARYSNDWIIDTDHIDTCIISPIGIDVEDLENSTNTWRWC